LLRIDQIRQINIPAFDELSVKRLWKDVSEDDDLAKYFPDKIEGNMLPERKYFFTVVNTVNPGYLKLISEGA
jgi:hypothetical protein